MSPIAVDQLEDLSARAAALEDAAGRAGGESRRYRIAGEEVTIHLERSGNASSVLHALDPLRVATPTEIAVGESGFDVYVWDGGSDSPVLSPLSPGSPDGPRGPALTISRGILAFADHASGVLSIYDAPRRRAHWWLNNAARAPYYETAAPLRHLLQARILDRGGVMLHAAAVGTAAGGILLVGGGGSGKSTSALACIEAGLGFASDDYVLVDGSVPPMVHMAYSTSKVVRASLGRHGRHIRHFRNLDRVHEKPMMFLHEAAPGQVLRSFPLRALVMPAIAHRDHTRIVGAAAAELLRAMVPSSLLLSPFAGAQAMRRMAALCRSIPCFRAELAESTADVGQALSAFVAGLPVDAPKAVA
jgi:hypothetical protein